MQEIQHIETMIINTMSENFTGTLYRATLEALIVEVGIGVNVLNAPYEQLEHLTTDSIIKTTWEFMDNNQITIQHDITIPEIRVNDSTIMQAMIKIGAQGEVLRTINKCRIFLKVYFLSDMYNSKGAHILPWVLQGRPGPVANGCRWPRQGQIQGKDWEEWRSYFSKLQASNAFYHR